MITTMSIHQVKTVEATLVRKHEGAKFSSYSTILTIRGKDDSLLELMLFADDAEAFARLFPVTEAA